jgi:hypothetical protein
MYFFFIKQFLGDPRLSYDNIFWYFHLNDENYIYYVLLHYKVF